MKINLAMVEAAVAGCTSFVRREFVTPYGREWVSYDYSYAYPALFEEHPARLECRGIVFDKDTGQVVCRPYHKFFNAGEIPGTGLDKLGLDRPHYILEKLDGSMIRPMWVHEGEVHFGTRAGVTEVSEQATEYARTRPQYHQLCEDLMNIGHTPIFEWCSLQNRVVIAHPVDRLVLTGIRDNLTGLYQPYTTMRAIANDYGVECVRAFDLNTSDREAFAAYVADLLDMEGFVIRFEDGEHPVMVKVKADDYVRRHKTLGILRSERAMFETLLDGLLDDAKSRLNENDLPAVNTFEAEFYEILNCRSAHALELLTKARESGCTRKEFATEIVGKRGDRGVLFNLFTREYLTMEEVADEFMAVLSKEGTKNDPDKIRRILMADVSWNPGRKISTGDE
ncbi:MAG: hypothetical protein UY48_C0006G0044 [Candidatus Gottesmanbacteria bacterium GW2011_GWB1_49_7]|uniref:T4 RNA ligase 1-like N-terminal domain-containing protein n=1 Tax=Candidatus Gottesmanbacteria bacterium GW2011_GWB1_49_7 TaxID=1618448 RepID=A0A0G1W2K0_9BACT|nr:MAG: hypothetical protein UY48_C0006G0044 [Candidatus Gottesmanbacteria bacterium GW2011_GWB1_49_7]